jgi:hypothetical protein
VVLDNTVLDYTNYDEVHPGGKFVLHKNIGRDISKYFYGGYKLVNDPSEKQYTHSASASLVANSLQVANIKGQAHVKPVAVKLVAKTKVNSIANCFKLQTVDAEKVCGFKKWHSDLEMIGRHFLIYSQTLLATKRQYTICNAISPSLYPELLKMLNVKSTEDRLDFDSAAILDNSDTDSIYVTAKDYHTAKGVAS